MDTPRISDLTERDLLTALRRARDEVAGGRQGIVIDSGDDAAVLRPHAGRDIVVTTDAFVAGVHYLPEWLEGEGLGRRLAAANLSDLAAMAATPRWALLSMGLNGSRSLDALLGVQRGVARTLNQFGAAVVGGNLTRVDGPEWFDLTLIGDVAPGHAWTRRMARAADLIVVTGFPGRAGAGCLLAATDPINARRSPSAPLIEAWLNPAPRILLAQALAASGGITAAVDISDGLSADIANIVDASVAGVRVESRLWPQDDALRAAAGVLSKGVDALRFAPSDDYELLLAVDPGRAQALAAVAAAHGVPWTVIGVVMAEPGARVWVRADGTETPLPGSGWDPFVT